MASYNCTGAHYRQNGGSWWSPLSGSRTPTGWNSSGSNKYETRLAFDFDAIRAQNATHSIVSGRLYVRNTGSYGMAAGYLRVTDANYNALAACAVGGGAAGALIQMELDAAAIAALTNPATAFLGTYNAANNTYSEFYTTETEVAYLDITWASREPNPQPPAYVDTPGTITASGYTHTWGAGYDANGAVPQSELVYDFEFSQDGGSSWEGISRFSTAGTPSVYVNYYSYLDNRLPVGYKAGQYFYTGTQRFRVRTIAYHGGDAYYSGYAYSNSFAIDYRVVPGTPSSLTPSKANPYEGESISFTCGRPSLFNHYDSTGATMALTYFVKLATSATLAYASEPITSGSKAVPYTVGELTSPKSDLSTNIRAFCRDAENQTGPETGNVAFTIRRFRKPTLSLARIDRDSASAIITFVIPDTGYGSAQANSQIRKVQYKLGSAAWADAPIGSWDGLKNSFTISGLTATGRYSLQIRAVNKYPDGTALSDITGDAVLVTITEYNPIVFIWKDGSGNSGIGAKAIYAGDDYTAAVDPGCIKAQNNIEAGGTVILTARTLTGDSTSGAFWRSVQAGHYWHGGSLTNAPTFWGFVVVERVGTDFSVMLYQQSSGSIWRTSGNSSTTTCAWVKVFDPNQVETPKVRATSSSDASLSSTEHAFQAGATNAANVIIDGNEIQGRNNGAASNIYMQAEGGDVRINGYDALHKGNIASWAGLGGACAGMPANVHTYLPTGFYMGLNTTNAPDGGWWFYIYLYHATGYVTILAFALDHAGSGMKKACRGGSWTAWTTIQNHI